MILAETIPYMISPKWEEKFQAEYWQIAIRVKNLEPYIESVEEQVKSVKYESDKARKKDKNRKHLKQLYAQKHFMYEYMWNLEEQAKLLGIDLNYEKTVDMGNSTERANSTCNNDYP